MNPCVECVSETATDGERTDSEGLRRATGHRARPTLTYVQHYSNQQLYRGASLWAPGPAHFSLLLLLPFFPCLLSCLCHSLSLSGHWQWNGLLGRVSGMPGPISSTAALCSLSLYPSIIAVPELVTRNPLFSEKTVGPLGRGGYCFSSLLFQGACRRPRQHILNHIQGNAKSIQQQLNVFICNTIIHPILVVGGFIF